MNSGQFIQWQDLFAVVDAGSLSVGQYDTIETRMREQAKLYPQGIACLVILPPETRPPPDDIKRAIKELLTRLAQQLSCLAYVVEGTGFKGVAARATLVGMKIFASRPYPIYVETSLSDAVVRVFPHLTKGQTVVHDPTAVVKVINDARASAAS